MWKNEEEGGERTKPVHGTSKTRGKRDKSGKSTDARMIQISQEPTELSHNYGQSPFVAPGATSDYGGTLSHKVQG